MLRSALDRRRTCSQHPPSEGLQAKDETYVCSNPRAIDLRRKAYTASAAKVAGVAYGCSALKKSIA